MTAERFWTWVDQRGIVRRLILFGVIWQTWLVTTWGMHFAETTTRTGMDVAAIIGAVTAPLVALTGYVFKGYIESRA